MRRFEWNDALEAAIREDPEDEGRWSVLEDWILERDDERARHVRLAKAGDEEGALKVTWEIAADLLELDAPRYGTLYGAIAGCDWRAGYIVRGYVEAPAATRMPLLDTLLARRAASLMTQLRISTDEPTDLATLGGLLARATCTQTLRRLIVAAYWPPRANPVLHGSFFASLGLDELSIRGRALRLAFTAPMQLRRLAVAPAEPADLLAISPDRFPRLQTLELDLVTLEHRGWRDVAAIANVLALPALETLSVAANEATRSAIARLAPATLHVD